MSSHQTGSMSNPHYSSPGTTPNYGTGGGTPDSQFNGFGSTHAGYGQAGMSQNGGSAFPGAGGGGGYGSPGFNRPGPSGAAFNGPSYQHSPPYGQAPMSANGIHSVQSPPTVSVTDYGSFSQYPDSTGVGPGNRGYDEDYGPTATDFDALFSGKSNPSVMITGSPHFPTEKANKVLGLDDPHNLVYENSGFSRTVHFDVTGLTELDEQQEFQQAEVNARKRRGFLPHLPHFKSLDHAAESIANFPKKSKSIFVSKSKMSKSDRWLEWSEKMRVEAQVKKEEFLRKQEEAAKNKLPTPIIKARKESVKFVNRDFVPREEETALSKAITAMEQAAPPKPVGKQNSKDRYTEDQWQKLHEYWSHPLFQKSRPLGFFLAIVAMFLAIPPVLSTHWVKLYVNRSINFSYTLAPNETFYYYPEYNCTVQDENGTCYDTYEEFSHIEIHGFWYNCTENFTTYSGMNDEECDYINRTAKNEWQSVIVGLLLFSLAAGFLACVLTTCGICVNSLAKKVYYYHSAGEIYFVCGICSMVALITYPAVLESSEDTPKHSYGIGYFLGWCMPICYYISAFCMTLDDMIHSITNDCCLFCRRGKKQTLDKVNV